MFKLQTRNTELETAVESAKAEVTAVNARVSRLEEDPKTLYAPLDAKLSRRKRAVRGSSTAYGYAEGRDRYGYGTTGTGGLFYILTQIISVKQQC